MCIRIFFYQIMWIAYQTKSELISVVFLFFFICVILLKNYSRSFYGSLLRRCYDGTNVLGDSDDKTYLIRQRHQFKLWSLVCYKNLLNYVSSHYVNALT